MSGPDLLGGVINLQDLQPMDWTAGAVLIAFVLWGAWRGTRAPLFALTALLMGTLLAYGLYPLTSGTLAEQAGLPVLPASVVAAAGIFGLTTAVVWLLLVLWASKTKNRMHDLDEGEETWWEQTRTQILVGKDPSSKPSGSSRGFGAVFAALASLWILVSVAWLDTLVDPAFPPPTEGDERSARSGQLAQVFDDRVLPHLDQAPHLGLARRVALLAKAAHAIKEAGPDAVHAAARKPAIRKFFMQESIRNALDDDELHRWLEQGELGPALRHPRLAELLRRLDARTAILDAPIDDMLAEAAEVVEEYGDQQVAEIDDDPPPSAPSDDVDEASKTKLDEADRKARERLEEAERKAREIERRAKEAERKHAEAMRAAERKADENRMRRLEEAKREADEYTRKLAEERAKLEKARKEAEVAHTRVREATRKAEEREQQRKAEEQREAERRRKAEETRKKAEAARKAEEHETRLAALAEASRKAEEARKRAAAEQRKLEEAKRRAREAEERREERQKWEQKLEELEAAKKKAEEAEREATRRAEEAERKRQEEEESRRKAAEAKKNAEVAERKRREEEARTKALAAERKRKAAAALARKAEEERRQRAEDERRRLEAEARRKAAAEKKHKEEVRRKRLAEEARRKKEAERRAALAKKNPPTPARVLSLYAARNRYALRPVEALRPGARFAFRAVIDLKSAAGAKRKLVSWRVLDPQQKPVEAFARADNSPAVVGKRTAFVEGTVPADLKPGRYTLEVQVSVPKRAPVVLRKPLQIREARVLVRKVVLANRADRLDQGISSAPAGRRIYLQGIYEVREAVGTVSRRLSWQVADSRGRVVPVLSGAKRLAGAGAGTFQFDRPLDLPAGLAPGTYYLWFTVEAGGTRAERSYGFEVTRP